MQKKNASLQIVTSKSFLCSFKKKSLRVGTESVFITSICRNNNGTLTCEYLKKKKETIEETLNDAINSYNEIAKVATEARDAESLSRIIDSKIRIIERRYEC